MRTIAHLDMDAFYASVDLLRYPELRGRPAVIGGRRLSVPERGADGRYRFERLGDYRGRGVVTTATYEARAFGVHSGMGLMKAGQLAPDAVLLPADFDAYRAYSHQFKQAVRARADKVEDRGIDELFIDLTDVKGDPVVTARGIRDAVQAETGLSCSIGLAANKLLAKIASDLEKPAGMTVLGEGDLEARIWALGVGKVNGIGPKATERLKALGIVSIGDLAKADLYRLRQHFGETYAWWLHEAAHGRDDSPVVTEREPKSISRESTFERDLHPRADRDELTRILVALCERVAGDLRSKGYLGRTIGIKLRYSDFRTVTRDLTLDTWTDDPQAILAASRGCLRRIDLGQPLRLLGVRVTKLASASRNTQLEASRQTTLPL
ncbi:MULTISPECIES: DNA polymerase IV [unclassified Thioalkalivibrio]|uniref:DNA polymerase IV n=1 Tax=unclassified Thioalkalivibrio TaxID=2621013 RepID=UPI001E60AEB7|nr:MULTISPECIES: DNA polymerase IV [unclassified Thioalkalivibrio]